MTLPSVRRRSLAHMTMRCPHWSCSTRLNDPSLRTSNSDCLTRMFKPCSSPRTAVSPVPSSILRVLPKSSCAPRMSTERPFSVAPFTRSIIDCVRAGSGKALQPKRLKEMTLTRPPPLPPDGVGDSGAESGLLLLPSPSTLTRHGPQTSGYSRATKLFASVSLSPPPSTLFFQLMRLQECMKTKKQNTTKQAGQKGQKKLKKTIRFSFDLAVP